MLEDSLIVFDFLVNSIGFKKKNILVFGRSIGSGPATYLSAYREPRMLILMSPFTSITNLVKDIFGDLAKNFVTNHFDNLKLIK
mgnify:CR=1 FL=1